MNEIGNAKILELKRSDIKAFYNQFYPPAKRTPSIGADGYHRMGSDKFAPYGITPKVFLPERIPP
ncbi:MAG: hypothetical protein IJ130_06525 [Solobacterium sp.]|nr:hypothetical protein [Solobacterium sp.]